MQLANTSQPFVLIDYLLMPRPQPFAQQAGMHFVHEVIAQQVKVVTADDARFA